MVTEEELKAELAAIREQLAKLEPEYERLRERKRQLECLFPQKVTFPPTRPLPTCVIGR